jgi:radical SAM superfamily enzyme YgiQ (UPF0313 family)
MGTQNISPAWQTYQFLRTTVPAGEIFLGGPGIEGLDEFEFRLLFPRAVQVKPITLEDQKKGRPNVTDLKNGRLEYNMGVIIDRQLSKFNPEQMKKYFAGEFALLFSRGCAFGCNFCGAPEINGPEVFYNTRDNLDAILSRAKECEVDHVRFYCTSLDFFQQALPFPGHHIGQVERRLAQIAALSQKYGIKLTLRALTRSDSYNHASEKKGLMDLVKASGFNRFGFGADGSASEDILRAMHKGNPKLKAETLQAFRDAEDQGFTQEILYVFGIPEDDEETLQGTRKLCSEFLHAFPHAEYRGFPAKNEIPGNKNWKKEDWKLSPTYQRLMENPQLFINLGFETLGNVISHPNPFLRKLTNSSAVRMSHEAHHLGRVQSFLTVPQMDTDGNELMDQESFEDFREIVNNYAPHLAKQMTLENLPGLSVELNELIPKDT